MILQGAYLAHITFIIMEGTDDPIIRFYALIMRLFIMLQLERGKEKKQKCELVQFADC